MFLTSSWNLYVAETTGEPSVKTFLSHQDIVPYFPPYSRGIMYLVAVLNTTLCPSEEMQILRHDSFRVVVENIHLYSNSHIEKLKQKKSIKKIKYWSSKSRSDLSLKVWVRILLSLDFTCVEINIFSNLFIPLWLPT